MSLCVTVCVFIYPKKGRTTTTTKVQACEWNNRTGRGSLTKKTAISSTDGIDKDGQRALLFWDSERVGDGSGVRGGGIISIKDEADCTDCYLNQGEQTEAARGRNRVAINSRRVDRRQEHPNEPHIKFRGSKTFTFAPHSSAASLSVRTKTSVWHLSECSFRYFLPAELKDTPIMLPDSQTTVQSKVRLCWNMRKIKQSCHHEPLRTNSLNVKLEIKENAEQTEWEIQYSS